VTISCVRTSAELLALLLLATVDEVLAELVTLVVPVLLVLVAKLSSTCCKSELVETADIDKANLPSGS